MRNVKIIHFQNGEEIICELIGIVENKELTPEGQSPSYAVQVKTPFGVAPARDGNGLMIYPWSISPFMEPGTVFNLALSSVVMVTSAPKEMERQFIEKTSDIAIPSEAEKSLILG